MPITVSYPPPRNIPLRHSALGICFVDDKGKIRSCRHGGELLTLGVDLRKGWEIYTPSKENAMFHVFEAKLKDGTVAKVGAEASDEQSAQNVVRAKLGLDHEIELKCVDCIPNATTANFDELRKSSMNKVGGNDSVESMQQNVPQGAKPQSTAPVGPGPVDPKLGFDDPKMQPPVSPVIHTADGDQPAQAPTNPSAPVVPPEGTASEVAPPNPPGPNLTVR